LTTDDFSPQFAFERPSKSGKVDIKKLQGLDDSLELSQVRFEHGSSVFSNRRFEAHKTCDGCICRTVVVNVLRLSNGPVVHPGLLLITAADISRKCDAWSTSRKTVRSYWQKGHELLDAFESIVASDPSPVRTTKSGFPNQHTVTSDDPEFPPFIMLSIRVQMGHSALPLRSSDWQTFTNVRGKISPRWLQSR
jgi:hypothetical protein